MIGGVLQGNGLLCRHVSFWNHSAVTGRCQFYLMAQLTVLFLQGRGKFSKYLSSNANSQAHCCWLLMESILKQYLWELPEGCSLSMNRTSLILSTDSLKYNHFSGLMPLTSTCHIMRKGPMKSKYCKSYWECFQAITGLFHKMVSKISIKSGIYKFQIMFIFYIFILIKILYIYIKKPHVL